MEAVFEREKLLAAFSVTSGIGSLANAKDLVGRYVKLNVQPGQSYLWATSSEHSVRMLISPFTVVRPGVALLPIDGFGALLRENFDEKLTLDLTGNILRVVGHNSYEFPIPDPMEYPEPPSLSSAALQESAASVATSFVPATHEIQSKALAELIRRTVYATDAESTRYTLGGVLFEFAANRLVAVATDARRLAKMELPIERIASNGQEVRTALVPRRVLDFLQRLLGSHDTLVRVGTSETQFSVIGENFEVLLTLMQGKYPEWRDIIQRLQGGQVIELVAGSFFSAVRQAALVCDAESKGLVFQVADGSMRIEAVSQVGAASHVELPVSYSGPPLKITLDSQFVLEFCRCLDSAATVTFEIREPEVPAVFRTTDGYLYVVMPMAYRK